ncbi:protein YIF1B-like [Watersipora subatra]|uniref:protein YIF1B-like n=1 Tax=Watersipora subatra TaxID=2589382 RepID=UPI00355C6040
MDAPPAGFGQPQGNSARGPKKLGKKAPRPANPNMFEDTSQMPQPVQQPAGNYYSSPPPAPYGNQQTPQSGSFLSDPMATMAMNYGNTLADQGKEYVQQNLDKYVSTSRIKYYFAVDTTYVGKKLALLLFPFSHSNWSVVFNQDEPVAPRYDVNAPDLYIPTMGFVTFVLVSAIALGIQGRFTPETIGVVTSSALGYLLLEILAILFTLYILAVNTNLTYLHWLSYCGYKYFGMVLAVLSGVYINRTAYYCILLYFSVCLMFFMTRSLKVQILPHSEDYQQSGNKRRLYVLLALSAMQPVFMWWLTFSLV